MKPEPDSPLVRWFADIRLADLPSVGGKNASLGEMVRALTPKGIKIPDGFALTAEAYRLFLSSGNLSPLVQSTLSGLDTRDLAALQNASAHLRNALCTAPLPPHLEDAVLAAYRQLQGNHSEPPAVAVRSSATAEDLPEASFAGQQESFLNVQGAHALLDACRRCFASLFTERAISYRAERGIDTLHCALSVGVQRMVRSDLAGSGVMFTLDTESGFRGVVLITATFGLGESLVQGAVTPDEYRVFKTTLRTGHSPILQKHTGSKASKLVYDPQRPGHLLSVPVPEEDRTRLVLNDNEILTLSRWACTVEDHYSELHGHPTPMDIEWAKDGITGEIFLLQARPETVESRRRPDVLERFTLKGRGPVLATGQRVGTRIASGRARVIADASAIGSFQKGEVLVTVKTDPDWQPILRDAAAVVTDTGGRTCHAAIVSRELGVPAVVGTGNATHTIPDGSMVTVSCAAGDTGTVFEGVLAFERTCTDLAGVARPRTRVMMNVADPGEAFSLAQIPNDGVGLARMEFIITQAIRIHPAALADFQNLADPMARDLIERITEGYPDKAEFFVEKLAQGIGTIAAAFHPKPVLLRLSDFKSNEYAHLIGGRAYEPLEENPMLGFRGASRYYHPRYQAAFGLECRAVRRVRETMGLTNLQVMIPFCRTPEEARKVQQEMALHGLVRGHDALEVHMMCELPSNVLLASEFTPLFDGFSIGSNDLTQLVLGVDRDSALVAPLFDERSPAVTRLIAEVIATCHEHGCKIGICGQAPSDYPEFTRFLIANGIDSISLNPDSVLETTRIILDAERLADACAQPATSPRPESCPPRIPADDAPRTSADSDDTEPRNLALHQQLLSL